MYFYLIVVIQVGAACYTVSVLATGFHGCYGLKTCGNNCFKGVVTCILMKLVVSGGHMLVGWCTACSGDQCLWSLCLWLHLCP